MDFLVQNIQSSYDTASANSAAQLGSQLASGGQTDIEKAAESFEAVFLNQMLQPMFDGLETDGPFGGGHTEKIFRSMFVDEVAKEIAKAGGIGIADQVQRELLALQEV